MQTYQRELSFYPHTLSSNSHLPHNYENQCSPNIPTAIIRTCLSKISETSKSCLGVYHDEYSTNHTCRRNPTEMQAMVLVWRRRHLAK